MFIRNFLLFISISLSSIVHAQVETHFSSETTTSTKIDTNYIEDLSNQLNLFLYGKTKYKYLNYSNIDSGQQIQYSPNDRFNVGFGFAYKWMGLGIAFNLPFINNDDDTYGKTERLDMQMNVFARKFFLDFFLDYYKGFYVKNPGDIYTDWEESMGYPKHPEMITADVGASFVYIINHRKFSYRASFVQNEIQKKMAGSLLAGMLVYYNATSADTAIIPEVMLQGFEEPDKFRIRRVEALSIGPLFGYAYNFVIAKRILITLSTVPGVVYQQTNTWSETGEHASGGKIGFVIGNKISISYNHKHYFGGFNYNDFHSLYNYDKMGLTSNVGNFKIFVGRRFNVKKKEAPQ